MNKHLLILAPVFLFAVFPAFASQDDKNNKGKGNNNDAVVRQSDSDNCDPEGEWKNHGEFVSCVSHQGRGGQSVSEAARSDVGKKHKSGTPKPSTSPSITPSVSVVPSGVPSVTPSVIPSEIPSVTPSASPSVTLSPTPEGEGTVAVPTAQLQAFITALEGMVNFLKNLL